MTTRGTELLRILNERRKIVDNAIIESTTESTSTSFMSPTSETDYPVFPDGKIGFFSSSCCTSLLLTSLTSLESGFMQPFLPRVAD